MKRKVHQVIVEELTSAQINERFLVYRDPFFSDGFMATDIETGNQYAAWYAYDRMGYPPAHERCVLRLTGEFDYEVIQ